MTRRFLYVVLPVTVIGLCAAGLAHAMGSARVAALQVGLVRQGLYVGPVDGLEGPATNQAVAALQKSSGVRASAFAGRRARAALGTWGKYELGARTLRGGGAGCAAAERQALPPRHGCTSPTLLGGFRRP